MLASKSAHPRNGALSEAHQVKALLRLVEDLGYDVKTADNGAWIVAAKDEQGERTVVGVDSAEEIATAARLLAESLHEGSVAPAIHTHHIPAR